MKINIFPLDGFSGNSGPRRETTAPQPRKNAMSQSDPENPENAEADTTPPQRVYPEPPTYEWDFWAEHALKCGIAPELVSLGRAVKREVVQHGWSHRVAELCCDEVMERLLVEAPQLATRLYDLLLETDGLRVAWVETGGRGCSDMIELDGSYF